jgi:hypothetical protein
MEPEGPPGFDGLDGAGRTPWPSGDRRAVGATGLFRTARSLRPRGSRANSALGSGNISDNSGHVTQVTKGGPGNYTVVFDRDVSRCATQATATEFDVPAFIEADSGVFNATGPQVAVTTFGKDGVNSPMDKGFSLTVFC